MYSHWCQNLIPSQEQVIWTWRVRRLLLARHFAQSIGLPPIVTDTAFSILFRILEHRIWRWSLYWASFWHLQWDRKERHLVYLIEFHEQVKCNGKAVAAITSLSQRHQDYHGASKEYEGGKEETFLSYHDCARYEILSFGDSKAWETFPLIVYKHLEWTFSLRLDTLPVLHYGPDRVLLTLIKQWLGIVSVFFFIKNKTAQLHVIEWELKNNISRQSSRIQTIKDKN